MQRDAARLSGHGAALWMLCALAMPALGASQGAGDESPLFPSHEPDGNASPVKNIDSPLEFDIPAQALALALQRYAALSGRPAVFSSAMVAGRMSSGVQGRHTPEEALHLLLEGSGLTAKSGKNSPSDAFILRVASIPVRPQASAADVDTDYGAWVQARVWHALCADSRTAPGGYRALMRFAVDGSGWLREVRLLTSTGDARRDAAMLEALRDVRMDRSPPPGMAQPLTMILMRDRDQDAHERGGPRCGRPPASGASPS